MTLLTALIYRHLRAQLQRGAHFFVYHAPTEPTPRPDRTNAPETSAASPPLRLGALDPLFRALALFGLLEWAVILWNVLTHPATVGIAGQSYGVRLFMTLAVGPGILGVGALLVWRVPRNVVGRYLILVGLTIIAAQYDFHLATLTLSVLALELFLLVGAGLALPSLIYLMLHFPSGQVHPPRFAPWVMAYAVVKVVGVMLEIMASTRRLVVVDLPINPLLVPALVPYHSLIAITIGPAGLSLPLGAVAGLVSMAWRYRAAGERERQQIKWVAWAGGLFLVFLPIQITLFANGALTQSAALFNLTAIIGGSLMLGLVAAIGIAILRYRLFDIDILINRTLVYGSLTAFVVGLYAVLVGGLGALFESSGNVAISLVATGLVAVMFQPLRERLQRSINRFMYGDRDDPYAVLSRLGQRLEATLAPETVLPTIVETIAQALRLPYVAIELATDTVAIGAPVAEVLRLPLTYQREVVGHLVLAPRAPGEAFTPADRRLLEDIAHQAGVAVHAVRLTTDLQRSRERIVTAREEERRRLRRDLHDGLGPVLFGLTLKLDAVSNLMERDPAAAHTIVDDLKRQAQGTIVDIRRLVYELRPPALDELGLVSALREYASHSSGTERVSIEAPSALPPLPAAVEVAVYRIALEALTNTIRHAHAHNCVIRLALTPADALQVEVVDDGVGLSPDHRMGVGLTSMRERAEELGGSCSIESGGEGGTRVVALIPLHKEEVWSRSMS